VDVLDDARHHRLELLAAHVRLEARRLAGRSRGARERAREAGADLGDRPARLRVGRLDAVVLVDIGVGEHRDRVAQVVEGDDHVGEHERHVGQAEHVRVGRAQRLDGAHAVVPEEAHRAARERRQGGVVAQRRLAMPRDLGGGALVGVAAFGQRPAQHPARLVADERPAPDPLPLLGRLEQEGGPGPAQLEEGRHRRLAVLHEGLAHRHEVVRARQRADLVERRVGRGGLGHRRLSRAGGR
jgi:hypothetical protein